MDVISLPHGVVTLTEDFGGRTNVGESYAAVVEFVQSNPKLATFLEAPQTPEKEKIAMVKTIFGDRVERLLLNLFLLLIEKNRPEYLEEIGVDFASMVEAEQGYQHAVVTTAVTLAPDLEEALTARLAALTGSRIILDKKVDPVVIGGVLVTLGDKILDGTVRTHLAGLKSALAGASLR